VVEATPGGRGEFRLWIENASQSTPLHTFRLYLRRVERSGGHHHGGATSAPIAVGSVSPTRYSIAGLQSQLIRYSAPNVSGDVEVVCENVKAPIPRSWVLRTRWRGAPLQRLRASADLGLKEPAPEHPDPYWAAPRLLHKLTPLARRFRAETGKQLVVTEGSLQFGGVFDCRCPRPPAWAPPHRTHNDGSNLDVRINDLTLAEQQTLKELSSRHGFRVLPEGDHLHLTG